MVTRIDRILRDKQALLLQLDDGMRENPSVFTPVTVDPAYGLGIALEGQYTGAVVSPGVAEKYGLSTHRDVPLIITVNARTSFDGMDSCLHPLCSVERAVKLGAQAIAITMYDGKGIEPSLFTQFGAMIEHAHDYGIPVIAWMHGSHHHEHDAERDAHCVRIALELGADAVSVRARTDRHAMEWIVRCAGRTAVLVHDDHGAPHELLERLRASMHAGATGAVLGHAVWHHPKPFSFTRAIHAVVSKDKPVEEALKYLT